MDTERRHTQRPLPTHIDRYPAKMVNRLAADLVARYTCGCSSLLDPFCGSGAVLSAAAQTGLVVTGADLNPYATLLSGVKVEGFVPSEALALAHGLASVAAESRIELQIGWDAKDYWFTPATLTKYERLRRVAADLRLADTREGRAVLLGFALSVRLCSRADQRSPKPFISKLAREHRAGRHFDPLTVIPPLVQHLGELYGRERPQDGRVVRADITSSTAVESIGGPYSHVITSPPYLNAQDYFRNFKLELYMLESILPFEVAAIRDRFVGTDRGNLMDGISSEQVELYRLLVPALNVLERTHPRLAAVVHRYLHDMGRAFDALRACIRPGGVLVIVCGDNIVGGQAIPTWRVLNDLLVSRGFSLFDSFGDTIERRLLPPSRLGHRGLIKQEVVSAFRLGAEDPH